MDTSEFSKVAGVVAIFPLTLADPTPIEPTREFPSSPTVSEEVLKLGEEPVTA
jgi:hypothetical protein